MCVCVSWVGSSTSATIGLLTDYSGPGLLGARCHEEWGGALTFKPGIQSGYPDVGPLCMCESAVFAQPTVFGRN